MKNILKYIFAFAIICSIANVSYAQHTTSTEYRTEIKAFEKLNKELLKNLKKQYKGKVRVYADKLGTFFIVISVKEGGNLKYYITDEMGTLLYPEMLDAYTAEAGYLWISQVKNEKTLFGAVNIKGQVLLPIKYSNISKLKESEADYANSVWHPASEAGFMTVEQNGVSTVNTFFNADCSKVLYVREGDATQMKGYFWKIGKAGAYGLYTNDGKEIFPQEYTGFYFESKTGMVNCYKTVDGLTLFGAKQLKPGITDIEVPTKFNDVRWNTTGDYFECRVHRGSPYERYDIVKVYDFSYKDEGEKLYDSGKFEQVITYYEGEGYGKVWSNYFMGLSASELADKEMKKMNNCINTLNSPTNYYLPLERPNDYKFDTSTIMNMYLSGITYFEKYINSTDVAEDDPTKLEARKLRGELVAKKNNLSKRIEDYSTALGQATSKNINRQAAIAAQKARQEAISNAAADAISNGIMNLFK